MPEFTIDDMYRFATEAWGPLGTATVAKWKESPIMTPCCMR
jgi:hypothetical protein